MKRTIYGSALAAALGLAMSARADDGLRADKPAQPPAMQKADTNALATQAEAASKAGAKADTSTVGDAKAEKARVVARLHQGNLKEIEMGGTAQKIGGPAVQRYGQMLVDDHKKADVDVLNYATKMGVSMVDPKPAQADPKLAKDDPKLAEHLAMSDLKALKGQAFDKQFLTMMVADHKQEIADVRDARAKLGEGDDLIPVLDGLLPTLQKHLDSAQTSLNRMLPQARRPQ